MSELSSSNDKTIIHSLTPLSTVVRYNGEIMGLRTASNAILSYTSQSVEPSAQRLYMLLAPLFFVFNVVEKTNY